MYSYSHFIIRKALTIVLLLMHNVLSQRIACVIIYKHSVLTISHKTSWLFGMCIDPRDPTSQLQYNWDNSQYHAELKQATEQA